MTNHYRKIKSAKKVIDTSIPIGYKRKEYKNILNWTPRIKKHDCGIRSMQDCSTNISNNSLIQQERSCKVKLANNGSSHDDDDDTSKNHHRPPTRRNLNDLPNDFDTRPAIQRRSKSNSPSQTQDKPQDFVELKKVSSHSSISALPIFRRHSSRTDTPLECLQFALLITEDIIRNEVCNYETMHEIFRKHMEVNKEQLEEEHMLQEIEAICKEINVPFNIKLIQGLPITKDSNYKGKLLKLSTECQFDDQHINKQENAQQHQRKDSILVKRNSQSKETDCKDSICHEEKLNDGDVKAIGDGNNPKERTSSNSIDIKQDDENKEEEEVVDEVNYNEEEVKEQSCLKCEKIKFNLDVEEVECQCCRLFCRKEVDELSNRCKTIDNLRIKEELLKSEMNKFDVDGKRQQQQQQQQQRSFALQSKLSFQAVKVKDENDKEIEYVCLNGPIYILKTDFPLNIDNYLVEDDSLNVSQNVTQRDDGTTKKPTIDSTPPSKRVTPTIKATVPTPTLTQPPTRTPPPIRATPPTRATPLTSTTTPTSATPVTSAIPPTSATSATPPTSKTPSPPVLVPPSTETTPPATLDASLNAGNKCACTASLPPTKDPPSTNVPPSMKGLSPPDENNQSYLEDMIPTLQPLRPPLQTKDVVKADGGGVEEHTSIIPAPSAPPKRGLTEIVCASDDILCKMTLNDTVNVYEAPTKFEAPPSLALTQPLATTPTALVKSSTPVTTTALSEEPCKDTGEGVPEEQNTSFEGEINAPVTAIGLREYVRQCMAIFFPSVGTQTDDLDSPPLISSTYPKTTQFQEVDATSAQGTIQTMTDVVEKTTAFTITDDNAIDKSTETDKNKKEVTLASSTTILTNEPNDKKDETQTESKRLGFVRDDYEDEEERFVRRSLVSIEDEHTELTKTKSGNLVSHFLDHLIDKRESELVQNDTFNEDMHSAMKKTPTYKRRTSVSSEDRSEEELLDADDLPKDDQRKVLTNVSSSDNWKPENSRDRIIEKLQYVPAVSMTNSMEAQVEKVILQVDKFRQMDGLQEHALKDILAEVDGNDKIKLDLTGEEEEDIKVQFKKRTFKEKPKEMIETLYDTRRVLCFETKIKKQPVIKNKPRPIKKIEESTSDIFLHRLSADVIA